MRAIVSAGVRLAAPFAHVAIPDVVVDGPGVTRLVGRNGSGKSTFVELCAGTVQARTGAVAVLGHEPADPRILRSRSVCRTVVSLAAGASVRQHVRLFAQAAGTSERPFLERLALHGPLRWIEEPTERLSTGLARLAWVVLTTTPRRDLVLLDEPFLGLDDAAAVILLEELDAWARGSAIVLVDHGADRAWTRPVASVAMPVPA